MQSPPAPSCIAVAESRQAEPDAAATDLLTQIELKETCFVLLFVPGSYRLTELATALGARLGGVPAFGCTSAGQITSVGYESDAILMLAFPKDRFRCASLLIGSLNPLSMDEVANSAGRLNERFYHTAGWHRLALILTDGLSKQEDLLVSALEAALGDVPVFGGSAGDALEFRQTWVLHGGTFHSNAALLLLIETRLAFRGLCFDHFLPTDQQMVITDARPEERQVLEINGMPAAVEYARLVGCAPEALSPQIFAENPTLVRYCSQYYVRAISDADSSQGMSFMAAIDDGLILTLGRGKEILRTLESELDVVGPGGGAPDFILGFDCVLRRLEIEQKQLGHDVSAIFRQRRVFGFNTFGEQHRGLHVNQTFVGVAFFETDSEKLH